MIRAASSSCKSLFTGVHSLKRRGGSTACKVRTMKLPFLDLGKKWHYHIKRLDKVRCVVLLIKFTS